MNIIIQPACVKIHFTNTIIQSRCASARRRTQARFDSLERLKFACMQNSTSLIRIAKYVFK